MQHLRGRPVRYVLLVLAVAVVVARVLQAAGAPVAGDDLDVYRSAAVASLRGDDPWVTGFVYLPGALVVFLPLAALPPVVAMWSWLLLGTGIVVTAAVTLARQYAAPPAAAVAVVFLLFPTESALQFGNVTAGQFGLLVAALHAARAGRAGRFGLLLGVGIVLKPLLVVCLLVPAVRREVRTLVTALVVPTALSAGVLLVVGHGGDWLRTARAGLRVAAADPASADLGSTLHRLDAPPAVGIVAGIVLAGLAALALRTALRRGTDPTHALVVPLVVAMLAGSVAWAHYPLLAVPLLAELLARGGPGRVLATAAAGCLVLPEVLHGGPLTAVPPAGLFLVLTVGLLLLLGAAAASAGNSRQQPALEVG